MWFTKLVAAVMVALAGLLPSSCARLKSPAAQQTQQSASVAKTVAPPESATNKNLGELQLCNNHETCVSLGTGKNFTIKPTQLDRSHLQLVMAVESKFANGGTKDLSVVQVITKTGQPFDIALGDMNLTLTPELSK